MVCGAMIEDDLDLLVHQFLHVDGDVLVTRDVG
jgi:hypothetical protein